MESIDLSAVEPFEVATRRPPTENDSLSFRVTRNCYWNKCKFCTLHRIGPRFSKRSLEEIKGDIAKAKIIDDLFIERGFGVPTYTENDYYKLQSLIDELNQAKNIVEQDTADDQEERGDWFGSWFKDKPVLEDSLYHILSWRIGGGKTCFLGDADSLILKPDFLHEVMDHIKSNFPTLERFTIYGRTATAARIRTVAELREFHRAGINRVHFGLESGSDQVLSLVNKGVTAAQHIEGCLKVKDAGLSCSIYIMPGLGGSSLSQVHAHETAKVINAIEPDFVRIRTLEIFTNSPLETMIAEGTFVEASEEEVVREIKTLIENIQCRTEILSDSAANLLGLFGTLPRDKGSMLKIINSYLALSLREKLEFSLHSRLRSFIGQYGAMSEDIYSELKPYLADGAIRWSSLSDAAITSLIRLVRSKLMP